MSGKRIVTEENYELFAVDYLDGKLSAEEEMAFFAFLEEYPGLKSDFELFIQSEPLKAEKTIFPAAQRLRKQPVYSVRNLNETNYQDYFVAFSEKDLNSAEKTDVAIFLRKNPHLQSEFESFLLAKLVPDKRIFFLRKSQLKRRVFSLRRFYYAAVSVAAVGLVLFLFRLGNRSETAIPDPDTEPITAHVVEDIFDENHIPESESEPVIDRDNARLTKTKNAVQEIPFTEQPVREEIGFITSLHPREPERISGRNIVQGVSMNLEADHIRIKTVGAEELQLLAQGELLQDPQQAIEKKKTFRDFLSWSLKQYSHITGEQVKVVRVEEGNTNQVTYYLK